MSAPVSEPAPALLRKPGRPRDARADAAILEAAVAVLAERGPSGFTVDAVAARAGCGKATIYRRWASRAELLLDTARRMGLESVPVDSGSVRDDLVASLGHFASRLRDTPAGGILPAVIAEAAVNPEMRAVLAAFVRDRRGHPREALARGVARGELAPDTELDLVLDIVGGAVLYRELVLGEPADEAYLTRLVDAVLSGAAAG